MVQRQSAPEDSEGIRVAQVQALTISLTGEQKEAIRRFWQETGGVGTVEILIDVVHDRIFPASIQLWTAK